jgi:hypothetical protein
MSKKIYDLVKTILEVYPQTRNDDKSLHFSVWNKLGFLENRSISWENYKKAPSTETIGRVRRKLQEMYSHLQPTDPKVIRIRKAKQETKGTFIYREEIKTF